MITSEKAATLPLHRVIELATKRYGRSMDEDILGLYESLKTDYNEYIEQIGRAIGAGACAANKRENKVFTISDEVPLLHYLTGEYLKCCKCLMLCQIFYIEEGLQALIIAINDILSLYTPIVHHFYCICFYR